jgi:hypothetical protein
VGWPNFVFGRQIRDTRFELLVETTEVEELCFARIAGLNCVWTNCVGLTFGLGYTVFQTTDAEVRVTFGLG